MDSVTLELANNLAAAIKDAKEQLDTVKQMRKCADARLVLHSMICKTPLCSVNIPKHIVEQLYDVLETSFKVIIKKHEEELKKL